MMKLFIDTCNWRLVLILKKDTEIIDSVQLDNTKRISDIALVQIQTLLSKNYLSLQDIKAFYLTNGPGSYTGVRVGLTIVKTLKTLNQNIKVFLINALAFQAGKGKVISLLDARGDKYYLGVYDNQIPLIKETTISKSEIDNFKKKYNDFETKVDNSALDYQKMFNELEDKFALIENIEDISPLYIKNFI